ncbi:hypothetical protein TR51_06750 [Kitasatospora griseola]|uniref:Uncharacterized protein n=1 Tax=Kitasatospora griseola TaxID=2064 RepID=A0A0D0Q3E3_KITGR|nr:hypothetical protein TR51_06750 [Kitasatospora griseola]
MTATPSEQGISPARLHGEACFVCGSTEPPLHPNGTITIDGNAPGVVHDFETVVCIRHREADRG